MPKQSQALQKPNDPNSILEQVITKGDLVDLTPAERVFYYNSVCQSLQLNPLTKPFDFLELYDKETKTKKVVLYANKDCAAQLRQRDSVSIYKIDEEMITTPDNMIYLKVTAYARTPDGKEDVDKSVLLIKGLIGVFYENAVKKAITQAKRRVTLSICGLGFLDETEIESIPGAKQIDNDAEAVMTEAEALTLSHKASGLDQWKCTRATAMEVIKVTAKLKAKGVDDETMRLRLPDGVASRKDLTEEQAQRAIKIFQHWLDTWNETVQGEVIVNG